MNGPVVFTHLALDPGHVPVTDADFIAPRSWTTLPKPEVVGLTSREFSPQNESVEIGESIEALALFVRIDMKDDRRHTLRKKVMRLFGKRHWWSRTQWGRTKKYIKVFALEGVVAAPGMTDQSARLLLSRIQEYAHQEERIVVVPWYAFSWSDQTDLEEYYVGLGFEKVDMKDGWYELVLTDMSLTAEEKAVDSQQTMISMSLWAGSDPPQIPYPGRL